LPEGQKGPSMLAAFRDGDSLVCKEVDCICKVTFWPTSVFYDEKMFLNMKIMLPYRNP